MGDDEAKVKLKLTADTVDVDKARGAVRGLGKDAKDVSASSTSSLKNLKDAFGSVSRAAGLVRNVLAGFGVVGIFSSLVNSVKSVIDSFNGAKREAEEFKVAQEKAAHTKLVDDLAESYRKLEEEIDAVAKKARHLDEIQDIAIRNARSLEDAKLELEEQKELADVDDADPVAAEKKAQIQARYAKKRGLVAATRKLEDVKTEHGRLISAARDRRMEADKITASTAEDDKAIADTRTRLDAARNSAESYNDEDATGFWSLFGENIKRVGTLRFGEFNEHRTEAGDALREKAKAEAKEYDAELKRLQEQKAAKLKRAESLRQEARMFDEKAVVITGEADVADVQAETARLVGDVSIATTDRALQGKRSQIAADEDTVASGRKRIAELESWAESEQARAQAAASRYATEQGDVVGAQNRYDMVVANGGSRKERSAALAALQRERDEALEAQRDMESVAADVANVLKGIKEEVGRLSSAVKSAQSRLKQNQTDAPEG